MIRPSKRGRVLPKWADLAIKTTAKPKRSRPKASKPEALIQSQVEWYIEHKGFIFLHLPANLLATFFARGGQPTGTQLGAMRDAAEAVRGVPDLLMFHPSAPGHALCIELKTEIGKLTHAQRDWLKATGGCCCRSFDEARAVIDEWLKDRGIS